MSRKNNEIYINPQTEQIVKKLNIYAHLAMLGAVIFLILQWWFPDTLMGENGLKGAAFSFLRTWARRGKTVPKQYLRCGR